MPRYLSPLVGANFYPPATMLLRNIPLGQVLTLEPEPENPYDPQAVRVMLDPQTLDPDLLDSEDFILALEGFGLTVQELLEAGSRKVGHLAAKPPRGSSQIEALDWTFCSALVEPIAQVWDSTGASPEARFTTSPSSKWLVEITLPEAF